MLTEETVTGQRARDDEREALIDAMINVEVSGGMVEFCADDREDAGYLADAILAAGYRKHPEPEITDAPSPGHLHLEDGSTFPRPAMESDEHHSPANAIVWYGGARLSREQEVWLASCADAFGYLVMNPEIARRKIPMIRRALRVPVEEREQ